MSLPFQCIAFYFKLESEQNWTELKSARVLLAQKTFEYFERKMFLMTNCELFSLIVPTNLKIS